VADDEEPPTRGGGGPGPVLGVGGWYVGPVGDPDRLLLLGEGIRGGEGTLWQARYLGRLSTPLTRAVKQLRAPPGAGPGWPDPGELRRLEDQRALLQHLRVEHLVTVYDVFLGAPPHRPGHADPDGALVPYVEMEWVAGQTLTRHVAGRPANARTLPGRLRYVADLAVALASMHSHTRAGGNPVLHRDVKPANCVISPERGLVLVDVSTVRPLADGHDPDGRHTPAYTAPEVRRDPYAPRLPASDAYALGALALFCLTGEDPGPDPGGVEVRDASRRRLRAAARRAGVRRPGAYVDRLLTALDPDPARRPADLGAWAGELRTLAGAPARARWSIRVAALGAVAGVVAAILLVPRGGGPLPGSALPTPSPASSPALPSPAVTAPAASSPAASAPAVSSPAVSSGAAGAPAATIQEPADGSDVPRCAYFQGAAHLPLGTTLVLAATNLDNHDGNEYLQPVFDWETAATRTSWRGAQFFGNVDDSIGQHYRVELRTVAVAEVRRRLADPANSPTWSEPRTTGVGDTLAAITVRRHSGAGAFPCHDN
jgi:serine/threonine protein kinase